MTIRGILAERLSPIKRRLKLETPIINEVPVLAQILSSEALVFPETLGGVIPIIVRGKAYGDVAGIWYRVTFPRSLNNPSVAVVGEARGGAIPRLTAPVITIATTELPSTSVEVQEPAPVVSVEVQKAVPIDIPVTVIPYVNESFPYFVSSNTTIQKEVCDPLNQLTKSLYNIQSKLNDTIYRINDGFGKTKKGFENTNTSVGDLRTKVNTTIDDLRKGVNTSIDDLRTKSENAMNDGLKTTRDNTQQALDTTIKNTQDAINKGIGLVIPSIHDAWGIPHSMIITPIHIRNVTPTGFEFQSYQRTTCYYIAVGSLGA